MEETPAPFDSWAIVEVMGHSCYAGKVTEQTIGGAAFVRVDVPDLPPVNGRGMRPAFTKLLGASSIFAITPCTERAALEAAKNLRASPSHLIDLPPPPERPALTGPEDRDYFDDELGG